MQGQGVNPVVGPCLTDSPLYQSHAQVRGCSQFIHDTNSCAETIHTLGVNGFAGPSTGQARANHGFGLNYSLAVRFRNNGCAYSTTGTCLFPRSSLELNPWTRGFPYLILSCSHRPTHSQCWQQWSGCAAAKEKKRWLSLSLEHTKNTSFFWSQFTKNTSGSCLESSTKLP